MGGVGSKFKDMFKKTEMVPAGEGYMLKIAFSKPIVGPRELEIRKNADGKNVIGWTSNKKPKPEMLLDETTELRVGSEAYDFVLARLTAKFGGTKATKLMKKVDETFAGRQPRGEAQLTPPAVEMEPEVHAEEHPASPEGAVEPPPAPLPSFAKTTISLEQGERTLDLVALSTEQFDRWVAKLTRAMAGKDVEEEEKNKEEEKTEDVEARGDKLMSKAEKAVEEAKKEVAEAEKAEKNAFEPEGEGTPEAVRAT